VFSRDNRGGDADKSKLRFGRLVIGALVLAVVAIVGISYARHLNREEAVQRTYQRLKPFKVHAGSIGGWPLGTERIIWFEPGSRLTDADAGALLGFASSKGSWDFLRLKLANTEITDQAVPILAGLDGVDVVDVSGCRITARGASELQQMMRRTKVIQLESTSR
jgi:hypothetical protein